MTKPKLALWLAQLMLPLSLLGACVRTVEVPVAAPRPVCPLPKEPTEPALSPGSAGNLVTLTPDEAVAIGLYFRDDHRWHEMAHACLGK